MAGQIRIYAAFEVKDPASIAAEKGDAIRAFIEATKKEKGCNHYQLFQDAQNPNKFAMFGLWETVEDFKRHHDSDNLKELKAKAAAFAVGGSLTMAGYKTI